MEQLAEKVKILRKKMGWAQEDMAREIGVSLSTVQRWERQGGEPTRLARRELKKQELTARSPEQRGTSNVLSWRELLLVYSSKGS